MISLLSMLPWLLRCKLLLPLLLYELQRSFFASSVNASSLETIR